MTTHLTTEPAGQSAGAEEPLVLPTSLIRELALALQALRYGAIELVVHDGRVVQLERERKSVSILKLRD